MFNQCQKEKAQKLYFILFNKKNFRKKQNFLIFN